MCGELVISIFSSWVLKLESFRLWETLDINKDVQGFWER